jgi:hypothetical protein
MSNLHFASSETPHSAQIIMRKRVLKGCTGPSSSSLDYSLGDLKKLEEQNHLLETDNIELKEQLGNLQNLAKTSKKTIEILEQKIEKVGASALKSFEARNQETSILKDALKSVKTEVDNYKQSFKREREGKLQPSSEKWKSC